MLCKDKFRKFLMVRFTQTSNYVCLFYVCAKSILCMRKVNTNKIVYVFIYKFHCFFQITVVIEFGSILTLIAVPPTSSMAISFSTLTVFRIVTMRWPIQFNLNNRFFHLTFKYECSVHHSLVVDINSGRLNSLRTRSKETTGLIQMRHEIAYWENLKCAIA